MIITQTTMAGQSLDTHGKEDSAQICRWTIAALVVQIRQKLSVTLN